MRNTRYLVLPALVAAAGIACVGSERAVATSVAQTLEARASVAPTDTPTLAVSPTNTSVPTDTLTPTVTNTPTLTLSPTVTLTPTASLTPTRTQTPTVTPTPTVTLPVASGGSCVLTGTLRQVGRVVSIVDGDTIDVNIAGAVFRVRYIGIDTPERDDYFFWLATNRNSELVSGQTVTLVRDVSETDQYDRILRYVLVGDTFVNYSLVRDGFAMASTYPPDVACSEAFAQAQQQARAGREGVWEPTNTPPPYVPPPPGGGNCSPAYPTVCIPPPPPDLDCGQISYRRFTVLPPDPHGFDGDHDGIGCESG